MGLLRRHKMRKKLFGAVFVAAVTAAAGVGSQFYKEAKVDERNSSTGKIARSIGGSVRKLGQEKREEFYAEMDKKAMEKVSEGKTAMENNEDFIDSYNSFSEQSDAFMNGEISFDELQKQSEEEFKKRKETQDEGADSFFDNFTEMPGFEMKGEYYIYGTVDKSGCYAEPCELFEERERLTSVDPTDISYNWAVFVKDGEVVEAWTSTDALAEVDLRPYTKEDQKKQYGSIISGKAENVTGYWHTPF